MKLTRRQLRQLILEEAEVTIDELVDLIHGKDFRLFSSWSKFN